MKEKLVYEVSIYSVAELSQHTGRANTEYIEIRKERQGDMERERGQKQKTTTGESQFLNIPNRI